MMRSSPKERTSEMEKLSDDRRFYDLERIWSDGKEIAIEDVK